MTAPVAALHDDAVPRVLRPVLNVCIVKFARLDRGDVFWRAGKVSPVVFFLKGTKEGGNRLRVPSPVGRPRSAAASYK